MWYWYCIKDRTVKCDKRTIICDIETIKCEDGIAKYEEKKSKGTTKCEKKKCHMWYCNLAHCEDRTVKCEKKVREPPNVTKELSYVTLESHNVRMEPLNVRKKKVREPPNVRKKLSHVMLKLHNVRMEPSNVRKK